MLVYSAFRVVDYEGAYALGVFASLEDAVVAVIDDIVEDDESLAVVRSSLGSSFGYWDLSLESVDVGPYSVLYAEV